MQGIAHKLSCHNVRSWVLSRHLRSDEISCMKALERHGYAMAIDRPTLSKGQSPMTGLMLDHLHTNSVYAAELMTDFFSKSCPVVSFNTAEEVRVHPENNRLHVVTGHKTLDDVVQDILGCRDPRVLNPGFQTFGPHLLFPSQIFFSTRFSLALVNIKPVLPGHVLIIPRRPCERFRQLTQEEVADLWLTARHVGNALEEHYRGSALTLAIQDGPDAGQSVPHVHVHVLPRITRDLEDNDAIYGMIDASGVKQGESFTPVTEAAHAHSQHGNVPQARGGIALDPGVLSSHVACTVQGYALGDGAPTPIVAALAAGVPVGTVGVPVTAQPKNIVPAAARVARTLAEMEAEAMVYRTVLGWTPDLE